MFEVKVMEWRRKRQRRRKGRGPASGISQTALITGEAVVLAALNSFSPYGMYSCELMMSYVQFDINSSGSA